VHEAWQRYYCATKHIQLMTAGMLHVSNQSDTRECQPYVQVVCTPMHLLALNLVNAPGATTAGLLHHSRGVSD
jgi:hypothetical protein